MIGNLWVSSAVAITVIFSASVAYKSYQDIQNAKNIQQSFEIITEIKELIAKQYSKDPSQITRDEIIAFLPKGKNWEQVLLNNRRSGSIHKDVLLDEEGNFVLNEEEKIKLLALRAKLKEYGMQSNTTSNGNVIKFDIEMTDKNISYKDTAFQRSIDKTIELISLSIQEGDTTNSIISMIENRTPYENIYQNMKESTDEDLTQTQINERKKDYFKSRIKEQLLSSRNSRDMKIYNTLKDEL